MDEPSMRDAVLDVVRRFPGIHLRALVRELGTSTSLACYHLEILEAQGDVRRRLVGGFARYFSPTVDVPLLPHEEAMLMVLRQTRPLEIVLAVLEMGPLQHRDLLQVVNCSKGTLSYQLGKLLKAGIMYKLPRGPDRGFHLSNPEEIRRLLSQHAPADDVDEALHELWDDLFGGHRRQLRR